VIADCQNLFKVEFKKPKLKIRKLIINKLDTHIIISNMKLRIQEVLSYIARDTNTERSTDAGRDVLFVSPHI
jgi:hypothetical protein